MRCHEREALAESAHYENDAAFNDFTCLNLNLPGCRKFTHLKLTRPTIKRRQFRSHLKVGILVHSRSFRLMTPKEGLRRYEPKVKCPNDSS
jgi:hypothetical protein